MKVLKKSSLSYKRFIVFEIVNYYPFGGLEDCLDSFDTMEEAIKVLAKCNGDYNYIYDRIDNIIYESVEE